MKVAIFEIGNFFDAPDIVRVFDSKETAINHVPPGFKIKEACGSWVYYADDDREQYLNIKIYNVETTVKSNQWVTSR